jgi:hypothetical protein
VLRGQGSRCIAGRTVNLEKLAKQLRRDLAANPKKAAALGLMVVVALYFWGPLVWKWASAGGNRRNNKVNLASLILTDDPAEPTQQSKLRGGAKFRWEKARQLIRQDPYMISATFDQRWPDPFGKPTVDAAAEAVEAAQADATAAAVATAATEPSSLGLVLGSVIIGPRYRVATINGEACHEGDIVELADKQDKSVTHQYKVVRISRQQVVLDFDGRSVMLELSPPKLAHGDEIERGKPRER